MIRIAAAAAAFVTAGLSLALPAAAATNILPGSGATVTGSSLYSGFNETNAADNLINGTSLQTYPNGDTRWVFQDGASGDETLTAHLASTADVFSAGFAYNGQDRIPTSFEVLTSMNGVTFTDVAGPSALTPADYGIAGIYTTEFSFTPVEANYVEIDFGQNSIADCSGCGGGAGQGAGVYQLYVSAVSVPEPGAWALMLAGFAGLGALLRQSRRRLRTA